MINKEEDLDITKIEYNKIFQLALSINIQIDLINRVDPFKLTEWIL